MSVKQKVLVVEDELSIRTNITLMLKAEGYDVRGAENGRRGVELARQDPPDLILCDVMMPELDGFGVLEALRADTRFTDTPFVFLTALDDRANMRRGMNLGADDYLTKPFTRGDLLDAVTSRLKRHVATEQAMEVRLNLKVDELQQQFRDRLAGAEDRPGAQADVLDSTGSIRTATVLFSDIRNFTTYSERLSAGGAASLLNTYFERACQPILATGGRILKFLGDGVMALFEGSEVEPNHARAALRAGLGMALAAHQFRSWVHERHGTDALPEFSIGVGIHTGEVIMCRLGTTGRQEWTAIGDSVNIASRLEGKSKELRWVVVASEATITAAGADVTVGSSAEVVLRGRDAPISVAEVIAVGSGEGEHLPSIELPDAVREALSANARDAAQAAKSALNETLRMITGQLGDPLPKPVRVSGYRTERKIGQGGMSSVYLARRESDDSEVVLKIVTARGDKDLLERFMQEAAILSSINHPNVVKIYDQGFSEDYGYIAMEYFTGGTLTDLIKTGLTPRQSLSLLAQAAGALREIHQRGIIHRDIKPENMMARADGTIALVDFGVARRMSDNLMQTAHGVIFGTPYYMSPEQATGQPVVPASDIYSLGVIFHEMLTQRRPYENDTVVGMLNEHANAPVPTLPADLAGYQGLLERMMAKKLQDRFANADELLDAIDALWTQIALASAHVSTR